MATDPICGMNVKKQTALSLTKDAEVFYFCSERCLRKFATENNILLSESTRCAQPSKMRWYKNKTVWVSVVLTAAVLLSRPFPVLRPFADVFGIYFQAIWWAILLGLVLGGVIDHFIPGMYISQMLARKERKTIFSAVILGFFMSACSHGILALAIQLHKKGASTSAVVAFLMASPWANLPLTIMLIGFFGVARGLYIIGAALIIAVTTGFIFQALEHKGMIEHNKNSLPHDANFSLVKDVKARFKAYRPTREQVKQDIKGVYRGSVALSNMVLWWILIGMGLAGLAGAYIPEHLFQHYLGPTFMGMIITLGIATVMEVCSEGTAPLAFEIFRQTGAVGNSFVFLMAGVATDYTEIGLLWHNVGKRTALWLPVVTVPQIIVFGIIANIIF